MRLAGCKPRSRPSGRTRSTAEGKVAELELKVERLEQQPRYSRAGTPMNGGLEPTAHQVGSDHHSQSPALHASSSA